MQTLLALVLVIISIMSHFLLSEHLGYFQEYPWFSYAGMLLGTGIIVWRTVQRFTFLRLGAMLLAVLLAGGFLWYTVDYSAYNQHTATLSAGDEADSTFLNIQLLNEQQQPVVLGELLREASLTLVVLNRGVW